VKKGEKGLKGVEMVRYIRDKEIEQKIKNMRNVIIYGYFGIDKKLVWNLLINEIPLLHEQIKKL